MKRYFLIIGAVLAIAGLMFGDNICPVPKPCDVPFAYDPNTVNYRIVGSYEVELGATIVRDFNSCDPDEDNKGFRYELLAGPGDVSFNSGGHLAWKPGATGTYYLDFRVWDQPIFGLPLSDEGTLIVKVYAVNRPPIIGGCSQ